MVSRMGTSPGNRYSSAVSGVNDGQTASRLDAFRNDSGFALKVVISAGVRTRPSPRWTDAYLIRMGRSGNDATAHTVVNARPRDGARRQSTNHASHRTIRTGKNRR